MNLNMNDLLANPEKHQGGRMTRVADLVEKKAPPKPVMAPPAVPGDEDYEAARRSLEKRHPHFHRKLLNLD
jgi:hypothetical protein